MYDFWAKNPLITSRPVQDTDIISVDERKADATARRWSVGADLLSKTDTITAFKKNSSGSGFVTNLQGYIVFRWDTTADVITTAAALRRILECSRAPQSRVFEKAYAHVHATCTVFVRHIVLACPVGKRDDANVVWWTPV